MLAASGGGGAADKPAVTVINRDGTTAATAPLPAPAVAYGLAVAGGRIYASLEDGSVVCLGR